MFTFLFAVIIISPVKSMQIGVSAGYQAISIKDIDDKIQEINSKFLFNEFTAGLEQSTAGVGITVFAEFPLLDSLRVYPCLSYLPGISFKGRYFYPDGKIFAEYDFSAAFAYVGAGLTYMIMPENKFSPYLGADCGILGGFGNNKITTYNYDGTLSADDNYATNSFELGYAARAGLRYGVSPAMSVYIEGNYNNMGEGIFAGAGILVNTDAGKAGIGGASALVMPDTLDADLMLAKDFYSNKDYISAAEYFKSYLNYKKDPVLYKLLGNSLYYSQDYNGALEAYEESLKLKHDPKLERYINELKAKLGK